MLALKISVSPKARDIDSGDPIMPNNYIKHWRYEMTLLFIAERISARL